MYQTFDVSQVLFIARRANHDRNAGPTSTAGAANPVDVILGVAGHVEVKDVCHGGNIKPACGDIGCHQKADRPIAKAVQRTCAVRLVQIAVDRLGVHAVLFQRLSDHVHVGLAVAKDDRVGTGVAFGGDQAAQQLALFRIGLGLVGALKQHHALLDIRTSRGRTCDFDLGRIGQEGIGNTLDFRCHRGRKEQRLTREGRHLEDTFNIRDETHVQHAVSFVDDHDFHVGQNQFATLEMVDQAAGRRDQHIDAFVDQLVLLFERGAADQQRLRQLGVSGIGVKVFRNLRRQFPCWGQHQRPGHPRPGTSAAQHVDHRQGETGGFAGARLGDPKHIAPFKGGGNRASLNRRRRLVARIGNCLEHFGIEVKVRKLGHVALSEMRLIRPQNCAARPTGLSGRSTGIALRQ